jgi:DedD protein
VKERLTGAVILVALIVLLVPELLSGPIRSAPRTSVAATAAEEPPLRSYTINLSEDAHAHSAAHMTAAELPAPASPAAPPAAPAAGGSAAVDGPGAAQAERQGRAPAAAATTAVASATGAAAAIAAHSGGTAAVGAPAATSAAGTSGAWMVQLGSFASRDNAERLAKQLRGGGLQVSVSQGATGRRLYRVRAGPVPDHAAAEQLAGKLRAQGHPGEIVPK